MEMLQGSCLWLGRGRNCASTGAKLLGERGERLRSLGMIRRIEEDCSLTFLCRVINFELSFLSTLDANEKEKCSQAANGRERERSGLHYLLSRDVLKRNLLWFLHSRVNVRNRNAYDTDFVRVLLGLGDHDRGHEGGEVWV